MKRIISIVLITCYLTGISLYTQTSTNIGEIQVLADFYIPFEKFTVEVERENVQVEKTNKELYKEPNILLEEVPELGYSYSPTAGGDTYICYKDILILGDDVYRYVNGKYIKTDETIQDMLGIEDNSLYYYRQYRNIIVACNDEYFLLYDMDTNMSFNYLNQDDESSNSLYWYLYDGYLYYKRLEWNEIKRIHLPYGEEQVVYSGKPVRQFAMRVDGKILCECWNDGWNNGMAYYLIEPDDNGEWKEEKIWEDEDRWEYVEWFACNQYGLFLVAELSYEFWHSIWRSEEVIIRENGTLENFDIEVKGGYSLFLDTGCLVSAIPYSREMLNEDSTHLLARRASGVIFYDYAGNVLSTHLLVEPKILQDGYYMRKLLYYDGKITALYTQKDTGELYIAQVEAEEVEQLYEENRLFLRNESVREAPYEKR